MYYKDGYAELAFTADNKKADAKPSFYGRVKWIVINDELNSFFEDQISSHGGAEGPQEVAITEEPVTIKGDDIGKYYITTELDKLIVTVTVPHGVDFGGFLSYEGSGSGASSGLMSSDSLANENEYVFRMTPMFSSSIIRFHADSVAGCTVTIRGEKGYT